MRTDADVHAGLAAENLARRHDVDEGLQVDDPHSLKLQEVLVRVELVQGRLRLMPSIRFDCTMNCVSVRLLTIGGLFLFQT